MADNKPRGKPFMEVPLPGTVANIAPGTREFVPQNIRKLNKADAYMGGGGPKLDDWYRDKPSQWEFLQNRDPNAEPDAINLYLRGGKVANFARGGVVNFGKDYSKRRK